MVLFELSFPGPSSCCSLFYQVIVPTTANKVGSGSLEVSRNKTTSSNFISRFYYVTKTFATSQEYIWGRVGASLSPGLFQILCSTTFLFLYSPQVPKLQGWALPNVMDLLVPQILFFISPDSYVEEFVLQRKNISNCLY